MNFLGTDKPAEYFWTPKGMIEERDYYLGDDYYMLEDEVEAEIHEHWVYKGDTKLLFIAFFKSFFIK